jgi:hypothetical protein
MNKPTKVAGAVALVLVLPVIADYFALFGAIRTERLDLITMNFITVDEDTGKRVEGVHARCFQVNNNNACAERHSVDPGTVSLSIPVMTTVTKSYLFVQNISLRDTVDSRIRIMFIHPDYANPVETFLVSELPEQSAHVLTISMPKSLAQKY